MRWVVEDKFERRIRMTEERWYHTLSHSKMMGQEEKITDNGKNNSLLRLFSDYARVKGWCT